MLLLAKMNKISLGVFLLNFCSASEQSGSLRERELLNEISPSLCSWIPFSHIAWRSYKFCWHWLSHACVDGGGSEYIVWVVERQTFTASNSSFVRLSYFRLSCAVIAWWELTKREYLGAILKQSKCFCWAQSHLCTCFPIICYCTVGAEV